MKSKEISKITWFIYSLRLESGEGGESVRKSRPTAGAFQAAWSLSLEPPLLPPGLINNSDVIKLCHLGSVVRQKR